MDDRSAWLAGLRVGDEVWVTNISRLVKDSVGHVVHRTPTGRLTVQWGRCRELVFNPDGVERGNDYFPRRLEPLTPERREQAEKNESIAKIRGVRWELLPLPVLREVLDVVERGS